LLTNRAGSFTFSFACVGFVRQQTAGILMRVEEEPEGLGLGGHGKEAYPGFTVAHK
jgi:hypothetical protein